MDIAEEARMEAERRYPFAAFDPYRTDADSLTRNVFVQGQRAGWLDHARWLASQDAALGGSSTECMAEMIERSSLGTPNARALRATVSDDRAAAIVARAAALGGDDK